MRRATVHLLLGLFLVASAAVSTAYGVAETPFDPFPRAGATSVSVLTDISWECAPAVMMPPGEYTIAFGTSPSPSTVETLYQKKYYDPGVLQPNTTYYVEVTQYDDAIPGTTLSWSFTTGSELSITGFTKHSITTSSSGPADVAPVDVDEDGDLDFFLGTFGDDDFSFFSNNGSEAFTQNVLGTSGSAEALTVKWRDLDGDGDIDAVTANATDDSLEWWENDGSENFTMHTIGGIAYARDFVIEDFDYDGDLDLVAVGYNSSIVYRYVNDGSENFSRYDLSYSVSLPMAVASADFDGGLYFDVVVIGAGGGLFWYQNNTSGGFSIRDTLSTSYTNGRDVATVDMDNDGDYDIVSCADMVSDGTDATDNQLDWWENDGSGNFTQHTISSNTGVNYVWPEDLDNDGDMDIAISSSYPDELAWYENDGAESFTYHAITGTLGDNSKLAVADVNGDGVFDVFGLDTGNQEVSWWESGNNNPPNSITLVSPDSGATGVQRVADLQWLGGDPDTSDTVYYDVYFGTSSNPPLVKSNWTGEYYDPYESLSGPMAANTTYYWKIRATDQSDTVTSNVWEFTTTSEFSGNMRFGEKTVNQSYFDGAFDVVASDVDGDGDVDVLGAAYYGDKIYWWENDGTSTVANWTTIYVKTGFDGAQDVHVADVDGDGDQDVLGAAILADAVKWWENDGTNVTAGWVEHSVDNAFDGAYGISTADMDRDGDVDILGAASVDDLIVWWENTDGLGEVWTEHTVASPADGANDVEAVDIDGDGDMDVVGAVYDGDLVAVWINTDGAGTSWTQQTISSSANGARSVQAADFDNDGDYDIVGALYWSNDVIWWENTNGLGTSWSATTVDADFSGAASVYSADVDGDGDEDIVSSAYAGGEIAWWANDGTGSSWTKQTLTNSFGSARGVYVADVDSDGDMDILGASYSVDDVVWWDLSANQAPNTPSAVFPTDGATGILVDTTLAWNTSDPDGDVLTYTVYFSTDANPSTVVSTSQSDTFYTFTSLSEATTYYWKVDAEDAWGDTTAGSVWSFTTYTSNQAPNTPSLFYPSNGAANVPIDTLLAWSATDPEGDTLTYKIYFGTTTNPPLVRTGHVSAGGNESYYPGVLVGGTTYYWKVVAVDPFGEMSSASSEGSFTTESFPIRTASSILSPTYFQQTGRAITRTRDGGYIMGGDMNDYYLARFDMYGDTLWTKKWGGTANDIISSIISIPGDSFVVSGHRYDGSTWVVDLIKMDGSGNIAWTKTFDDGASDFSSSVVATEDGGYIVAGYSDLTDPDQWYDGLAWKVDNAGNTQWANTFCGAGAEFKFFDVIEAPDGGYVFAGTAYPGLAGSYGAMMMKVSTDGDSLWAFKYGTQSDGNGSSVATTPDSGYVFVGYTGTTYYNSNGLIVKTDKDGAQSWIKNFGGADQETFKSVALSTDGDYLITGSTKSFGTDGSLDLWLVRADENGDTLWTKKYGQGGTDIGYAVAEGCDGGIIVAGTIDPLADYSYNFYTIKTDADGVVHSPPNNPSVVQPTDAASGVDPSTSFQWSITDPDGDSMLYTIYLDTSTPPTTQVRTDYAYSSFTEELEYNGTYYWQVVAYDEYADTTYGPIWSFSTETNTDPNSPVALTPWDEMTVSRTVDLEWMGSDPDGDPLSYDIYLATSNPPTTKVATQSRTWYSPGVLAAGTTYYWKIVADDNKTSTPVGSDVYSFTTENSYGITSLNERVIDATISGISKARFGDLDGDGDLDIAGCSSSGDAVYWWANDGNENFTRNQIVSSFTVPTDIEIVDLDQDGDLDILSVASGYSQSDVAWFVNNGSGSFTYQSIASHYYIPTCMDVGDIDLDGDLDIAVGSYITGSTNRLSWYENDGYQNFTQNDIYNSSGSGFRHLQIVDVQRDGDMDIVTNAGGIGEDAYWQNNGSQTFTRTNIGTGISSEYAYAADINNDGYYDFLSDETYIHYYEADYWGSFAYFSNAGTITGTDVIEADMEGDGDVDLIVAGAPSNNIKFLKNDGSQNFTSTTVISSFSGASSVDIADLDGDGDLDILGASPDDGKLVWFESLPDLPPDAPVAVNPAAEESEVSFSEDLTWSCYEPNNQALSYDIYFGRSYPPPLVATAVSDTTYDPGIMIGGYPYYWKIVATDSDSNSTEGEIWSFNTASVTEAQWKRTAGSTISTSYWETATSVTPTDDGGYAVLGYNQQYQWWLVKYDADGNEEWDNTYLDSYYSHQNYQVIQTSDGGFLMVSGYQASSGDDIDVGVVKTNASGSTEWWEIIDRNSTNEEGTGVAQTADGGYIICGWTAPTGTSYDEDGYLLRLDANGDTLWTATYDGGYQDIFTAVIELGDGSFAMSGYRQVMSGSLSNDFWLLKVDSEGTQVFSKTNGGSLNDYGYDLVQLEDGRLAVAGYGESTVTYSIGNADGWLVIWSEDGSSASRSLYGTTEDDYFRAIDKTVDGGLILAGDNYNSTTSMRDAWLQKVDDTPAVEWDTTYSIREWNNIYDVHQAADEGFVLAGKAGNNLSGEQPDFLTIKTLSDGSVNEAPFAASSPSPATGSVDQTPRLTLSWSGSDPDDDPVTYNLLLDTNPTPSSTLSSGQSDTFFAPTGLTYSTTYYWQVVTYDNHENSTPSTVWAFTTAADTSPATPWLAWNAPGDSAENVSRISDLYWHSYDADGDQLVFDVYFGTTESPSLVSSGQSEMRYNPGVLDPGTTYYWKIIADDQYGKTATSPTWSFTTASPLQYVLTVDQTAFSTTYEAPYQMDAADLDKDGDLDLLSLGTMMYTSYMKNNGESGFGVSTLDDGRKIPTCTKVVDFDFDGDADVLAGWFSDSTFAVYENDGSQNFTYHEVEGSTYGVFKVDAADMDSDGDLDVVGIGRNSNTVAWFENTGSWGFTKHVIASLTWVENVYAVDLNDDGAMDIVALTSLSNVINAYVNDGDQNFTLTTLVSSSGGIEDIDFEDIDNDGDLDFAAAEMNNNQVTWYENLGSLTFTQKTGFAFTSASTVDAVDMDGDGDFDLLAGSGTGTDVVQYENDGAQNFSFARTLGTNFNYASDIHGVDVNADGVMDAVASAGITSSLSPMTYWEITQNNPPAALTDIEPADGATDLPVDQTLAWSSSDPDGDALAYTLYFDEGASATSPVSVNADSSNFDPGGLTLGSTYSWKVVAYDAKGDSTVGSLWSFTVTTNIAPYAASVSYPSDAATDIETTPTLSWSGLDPNTGDVLEYDVYFGATAAALTILDSAITDEFTTPGTLDYDSTYYWKVVTRDQMDYETEGSVWSFTVVANQAPSEPSGNSPSEGGTGISITPLLSWTESTDNEDEALVYDVYFGTDNPPTTEVVVDGDTTTYQPATLEYSTTYYWQVEADDSYGNETYGPVWFFTTISNDAPSVPSDPTPGDLATDVSIDQLLAWTASTDTEGETVTYDVYFGTVNPPVTQVVTNGDSTTYDPVTLDYDSTYYWQVVSRDTYNNTAQGDVWSFTVVANGAPDIPNGPTPLDAATDVSINQNLAWAESEDGENEVVTYDLFFDTVTPPVTQVITDGDSINFEPGVLDYDSTYYWQVFAKDTYGNTSEGPIWSFTVVANGMPDVPSGPTPLDAASDVPINQNLAWSASSDAEGETVTYDLFFDTVTPPATQVITDGDSINFEPGVLDYDSTYYWQVFAKDTYGNTSEGPIWSFTVIANEPPGAVEYVAPENNSTNIELDTLLSWNASLDPEGTTVVYDVFFGTTDTNPPMVGENVDSLRFPVGTLDYMTTYYWKVHAKDQNSGVSVGEIQSFTTVDNKAPSAPSNPSPANQSTDISFDVVLSWDESSDFEEDAVVYDVLFGTAATPTESVVEDGDSLTFDPDGIKGNTTYFWKVIAKDSYGNLTEGSVWSFTAKNSAPGPFTLLEPMALDTTHESVIEVLWSTSVDPDPDGEVNYIVEWSLDQTFAEYNYAETADTFYTLSDFAGEGTETTTSTAERSEPALAVSNISSFKITDSDGLAGTAPAETTPAYGPILSTDFIAEALPQDTSVYLRVRAVDNHDAFTLAEEDEDGHAVWVDIYESPAPFSLVSPVDGSSCYTLDTTLVWNETLDPDPYDSVRYEIWMAFTRDLSDAFLLTEDIKDTSFEVSDLESFTTYYWTIHAVDTNTEGTWASDTLSFETIAPVTSVVANLTGNRFEWISYTYVPSDLTVSTLFDGLGSNLVILRDDNGRVVIPSLSINGISSIEPDRGYQLFVSSDATLTIEGIPVDPNTEYTLSSGRWNLIANPLRSETDVTVALSDISTILIAVQNDDGNIWAPNESVRTLNTLQPGVGYQILLSEDATFVFHEASSNSSMIVASVPKSGSRLTSFTPGGSAPLTTGLPYNVFVEIGADVKTRGAAVVELLDGEQVVGSTLIGSATGSTVVVTAWEGLPNYNLEGFTAGHAIKVRVLDSDGNVLPTRVDGDLARYSESAYGHRTVTLKPLPETFQVANAYPNPFNPTATIRVGLPEDARVKVTVYNLLGQEVAVLQDGRLSAGYHRLVVDGSKWASGVYFVRINVPGKLNEMKKIVLVR